MKLEELHLSDAGEQEDDMLQFKDSERDSVVGYFKNRGRSVGKLVDTPTRLLNNSNDFLPLSSMELPVKQGKEQDLMTPRREFKVLKDKL